MANDSDVIDFTPERLAKLRNLRPYRGKSDDEIIESIRARTARKPKVVSEKTAPKEKSYDSRFKEKMKILLKEFELDINNSNDKEMLNTLVRQQIQLENVNKEIDALQMHPEGLSKEDTLRLKTLGEFQRNVLISVNDLSDKLGITRKQRKEKAVDDIPQWIDGVLERAKEFFEGKTVTVNCPKCVIELFRYWVNFPQEKNDIRLNLTCWKCKEEILHIG